MKPLLLLLTLIASILSANGTPRNSHKALLTVKAYRADGTLLHQSSGFFISQNGEGITTFSSLKDATRAEVIDAHGRKHTIHRILGANSNADLVKFIIADAPSCSYIPPTTATATDQPLYVVLTTGKKAHYVPTHITATEPFLDYAYYQIATPNDSVYLSHPIVDAAGRLIAIVQQNVTAQATTACALDARFISTLSITPQSAFNADLNSIHIAKSLPTNSKDAMAYLFMLPQAPADAYLTAVNDYLSTYPDLTDGYVTRANFYAQHQQISAALSDYQTAIDRAHTPNQPLSDDAIHYNWSNAILRSLPLKDSTQSNAWNLSKATAEAEKAYNINPQPLYATQKGKCYFAQGNYAQAYDSFMEACRQPTFASADLFYMAAIAHEKAGGSSAQVTALLDSCIQRIPQPATPPYSQYYWQRAQRYIQQAKYRQAVFDYNSYEQIVGPRRLTAEFYHHRHLIEIEAHMYQQALDDINTAIATSANPYPYLVDEAYLFLRIGEYQSAIKCAEHLLQQHPDDADCHKILGIAYSELKDKATALKHLQKAQSLGDNTVDAIIKRIIK